MDAQPYRLTETSAETGGERDAGRKLAAQVSSMVETLAFSLQFNPLAAFLWSLPFLGWFPIIGQLSLSGFCIVMASQLITAGFAGFIKTHYRKTDSDHSRWLAALVVYQVMLGFSWAAFVCLLWKNGNLVNNALIAATTPCIFWGGFSRSMHLTVHLAGVVPTMLALLVRIFLAGGPLAMPLIFDTVVMFAFILISAVNARKYIAWRLNTAFANEDLTADLRRTRDEALRKRFEAEAANASKTTFLANMSHELRTPLNAILGFSEIIAHEALGPEGRERYREYARDIHSSGSHLLSIINDILDIAKIESGKMEIASKEIDPKPVLESVVRVVKTKAVEKRQTVTLKVADEARPIFADERALKQIVLNLLSNAVKFTHEGGNIVVSLEKRTEGGCELCVADNGPGIAASLIGQVFTPFNQIDNRYSRSAGGTGLGLSLVRGLAELHSGRAWLESDLGKGVQAYVYFPMPGPSGDERLAASA